VPSIANRRCHFCRIKLDHEAGSALAIGDIRTIWAQANSVTTNRRRIGSPWQLTGLAGLTRSAVHDGTGAAGTTDAAIAGRTDQPGMAVAAVCAVAEDEALRRMRFWDREPRGARSLWRDAGSRFR
jgi:hypothetical protein